MFHQFRLLPEDHSLLRFVWRDLHCEKPVAVYEWQVLPFGTACRPCCATFALQRHTRDHTEADDLLRHSVGQCFYVDNLLQSVPTPEEARDLVDRLRALLSSTGFVLRQWASDEPSTIGHLPEDLRSKVQNFSSLKTNQTLLRQLWALAGTSLLTPWATNIVKSVMVPLVCGTFIKFSQATTTWLYLTIHHTS